MNLVLCPKAAASSDRIRVWVGAFQRADLPVLTWKVNGGPASPQAVQSIRSARPDEMLSGNPPRAFCGLYEFTGLTPDRSYTIEVTDGVETSPPLETRTLPDRIPADADRWFNLLLVSCFHRAEDPQGLAGVIVSQLNGIEKPHLTLLMGDQVYLDLPTLKDFPDDLKWLANKFEEDYVRNWRGPDGYAKVLASAPSVSTPDDHEYWNNFPHPSPVVGNTLFQAAGRRRWTEAAQAMYRAFQNLVPGGMEKGFRLEVSPLSFFVADTRSFKDLDRSFSMPGTLHLELEAWVDEVIQKKQFGIFVSGQSLFVKPAGFLTGKVGDYELSNYKDFSRLARTLGKLADAGRPLICLTGDVHWGRVVESKDVRTGRSAILEVISSPSSLVTSVGSDQIKKAGSFLGGLFGKKDPWPRHSDPEGPPSFFAKEVLGGRFPTSKKHAQPGNHVAMLRFRQHGTGMELRIKYWPIHSDRIIAQPVQLEPFYLSSL